MLKTYTICLSCFVSALNIYAQDIENLVWTPTQKWDAAGENAFSIWVNKLGTARANNICTTLLSCIKNSQANSLYTNADSSLSFSADCADTVMIFRSYFAYKTKRPFYFVSEISGSQYTNSNYPTKWANQSNYTSISSLISDIRSKNHTGFFRMKASTEKTDTYPIDINKDSVKPGTVFYDPNGHILIVYKVENNGIVRFVDGHTDNSFTVTTFGERLARGTSDLGGGFRNWRNYTENSGVITYKTNAQSTNFSSSAQYKNSYNLGTNVTGNYYDWVRYQLAKDNSIKPEEEMRDKLSQICSELQDRVTSVKSAINAGIDKKTHPTSLPSNIYGSSGEWETYSTPARDARLKAGFREAYSFINKSVGWLLAGDSRLVFTGTKKQLVNLYQNLWNEYLNKSSCKVVYNNSKNTSISLTLAGINDRIYDLSFDPYHCVELRWGAKIGSTEYNSCTKSTDKETWYNKEYRLRNIIDRNYGGSTPLNSGPEIGENINIPSLLKNLSQ